MPPALPDSRCMERTGDIEREEVLSQRAQSLSSEVLSPAPVPRLNHRTLFQQLADPNQAPSDDEPPVSQD